MLPVSHNSLTVPAVQFGPAQPPCIPQINFPREAQSYLPLIASTLANQIAYTSSQNPSRTFTHNLIGSNGYANQYFQEAFEIATWLAYRDFISRQHPNFEQAIQAAAEAVATLMASKYVFEFPDLKSVCDPASVHSASQNYGYLNSLKMELGSLQSRYQPPQVQAPMYPQYPQPQQPYPQMQPQQAPVYQQQYPQQYPNHYQQHQYQFAQPQVQNTPGPSFGNIGGNQFHQNAVPVDDSDRYARQTKQPAPAVIIERELLPETVDVVDVAAKEKKDSSPVIKLEEMEMDRDKHTIYFADGLIAVDRYYRMNTAVATSHALVKEEIKDDAVYMNPNILGSTSLGGAILEARIIQRQRQHGDAEASVFRAYSVIMRPFVSSEDYSESIDRVLSQDSIGMMSRTMRSISEELAKIEHSNTMEMIVIIEYMDRYLTKMVNRFLAADLEIEMKIDSVLSDGTDLIDYIIDNFKNPDKLVNQLKEWQKKLPMVFARIDPAKEADIVTSIVNDHTVGVTVLPVCVSITLVELFDKELGFCMKPGIVYEINPLRHEMIYNIAKSLPEHAVLNNAETAVDYLVTMDDVMYTLHKSKVNEGKYLIALA